MKQDLTNMYAEERQRWIVERARAGGRVEVAALAEELGVTTETVRRDLTTLERHALLRRVHGGAIPIERLGFEPALAARDSVLTAEKERIARLALAELPDEGSILLDAGTTTARLAEALPADRELVVLTNGLPIAMSLSVRPEHHGPHARRQGSRPDAGGGRYVGPAGPRRHLRRRRLHRDERHQPGARPDDARHDRVGREAGDDPTPPAARSCSRTTRRSARTTCRGSPSSTRSTR